MSGKYDQCKVEKISFANPLKSEVYEALYALGTCTNLELGFSTPSTWKVSTEDKVRWINSHKDEIGIWLQFWGTNFRRGQDNEYWIKQALKTTSEMEAAGVDAVIIDDCRFPNEHEAVKRSGFHTIKLVMDPAAYALRIAGETRDVNHPSETSVDFLPTDFTIHNDSTIDDLYIYLKHAFETILTGRTIN